MKSLRSRTAISLAVAIGLTGCAHSLVYNEARDKLGQEAKRSSSALKIVDSVRALEKGYAEVAKLEVDSAQSLAQTLRNKELARVSRAPGLRDRGGFLNVIETRVGVLGAKTGNATASRNCGKLDCAALVIIQGAPVELREKRDAFELSRAEFRAIFGHDFMTCADVTAARDETSKSVVAKDAFVKKFAAAAQRTGAKSETYYADLHEKCTEIATEEGKLFDQLVGTRPDSIRAVWDLARETEREVADYRAKLVQAQAELAAAVKAYTDQEKALAPSKDSRLKGFEERAQTLKDAVEKLKKGTSALGIAGSHAATKELVSKLETVLGAVTGHQPDADKLDADDRAAVAFVRAVPELVDEADKLLKEAGRPRLVPFAIAREHYRLEVKGYEDEIAIKIRRMQAQRARADAMMHELRALARAHFLVTEGKSAWESQPLSALVTTGTTQERHNLYEALAIYWDEVFLHRSQEQVWKARATALRYDEGLARSTAAALQWDNLIGGVGTVLADYHASGVKPAEIAEFLKAIGLFYIGARVD